MNALRSVVKLIAGGKIHFAGLLILGYKIRLAKIAHSPANAATGEIFTFNATAKSEKIFAEFSIISRIKAAIEFVMGHRKSGRMTEAAPQATDSVAPKTKGIERIAESKGTYPK